jgi:ABC-type nitrate/sulfonate/bicarbonate transport system substrate-binding protein
MKFSLLGVALPLVIALGGVSAASVSAGPIAGTTSATVVAKARYASDSLEAGYIVDWIKRNSPAYAPALQTGELTISHTYQPAGNLKPAGAAGPPVPLPARGVEGEVISISNTLPSGASESWTYRWSSGAWKLIKYSFDACQGPAGISAKGANTDIAAKGPCID